MGNLEVYDGKTKALKFARPVDTSNPEDCLIAIRAIFRAGTNITQGMNAIPREDKQKLFDYLNDEDTFPAVYYTKQIEEIHEALGMDLT